MPEQFIIDLLMEYRYPILFLGLFFGGDTVLLIAIYLSLIGIFTIPKVILVALVATLVSDVVWYFVGTLLTYERIKQLPYFRKHPSFVDAMEKFFEKHALRTLFYSKFVYGTRTIVQILCGTHRVNLPAYFIVNMIGTFILIMALTALGMFVGTSISRLQSVAHNIELGFAALILLIFLINSIVKRKLYGYIEKNQ